MFGFEGSTVDSYTRSTECNGVEEASFGSFMRLAGETRREAPQSRTFFTHWKLHTTLSVLEFLFQIC